MNTRVLWGQFDDFRAAWTDSFGPLLAAWQAANHSLANSLSRSCFWPPGRGQCCQLGHFLTRFRRSSYLLNAFYFWKASSDKSGPGDTSMLLSFPDFKGRMFYLLWYLTLPNHHHHHIPITDDYLSIIKVPVLGHYWYCGILSKISRYLI